MFKSYETWKRNLASYNIIMNKYLIFYLGGGGEEWSGGVGWGGEGERSAGWIGGQKYFSEIYALVAVYKYIHCSSLLYYIICCCYERDHLDNMTKPPFV